LSIADFGLASAAKSQLAIGNRKSKIRRPTRYREVVLTSCLAQLATQSAFLSQQHANGALLLNPKP
jgi:hypothetical protein